MAKHSKYERDLINLNKPALHKKRENVLKEFVDPTTDDVRAADLLDELDTIESKINKN